MTKSELIEIISAKQKHLPAKDIELAVKQMLEIMSDALAGGERIEIRGFGSFSLHFRPPRQGRNPPHLLLHLNPIRRQRRQARRIIAPILQTAQAIQQNGPHFP